MSVNSRDWAVEMQINGRSGSIIYREAEDTITFYCEFGGGNVAMSIQPENQAAWNDRFPWSPQHRSEVLQRIGSEVALKNTPGCIAEIDAGSGIITIRLGDLPKTIPPNNFIEKRRRMWAYKMILASIALAIFLAFAVVKSCLSVRSSSGTPLSDSARASGEIVTLIKTLEGYIPSLHRNPENDRYTVSLFVYPVDGRSKGRSITIDRDYRVGQLNLARVIGFDGQTAWCYVNRVVGVDLKSGKLVESEKLRKANPALDESWDDYRRLSFETHLRAISPNRQSVYEVDPKTLKATLIQFDKKPANALKPDLLAFQSPGARISPNEWLGVHTANEAKTHFKPTSWLPSYNNASSAKVERFLYKANLGPELEKGNRMILSMDPISDRGYIDATLLRAGPRSETLRLASPDSYLMIYTKSLALGATLQIARIDLSGNILWEADTGIDRFNLKQILPDSRHVAFTGPRPRVPEKLPEPILVIVNTQDGTVGTASLWQ